MDLVGALFHICASSTAQVLVEDVIKANQETPAETAQLVLWGGLLGVGTVAKILREAIEFIDLFVGVHLHLPYEGTAT